MSISNIFSISQSSLESSQTAIQTTARNIANANTPGYSCREIHMSEISSIKDESLISQLISGVKVEEIARTYNDLLTNQVTQMQQSKSEWAAKEEILSNIESIIGENNGVALNDALNEFWGAWQKLTQNPSSIPERNELISKTNNLSERFNNISEIFTNVRSQIENQIDQSLGKVNTLLEELSNINIAVIKNYKLTDIQSQENLNALLDERDKVVEEISGLIGHNSWKSDNGTINSTAGGTSLLEGNNYSSFQATYEMNNGEYTVHIVNERGHEIKTDQLTGGEIKGLVDSYQDIVPSISEKIDDLAYYFIKEVNILHGGDSSAINFNGGYDLYSNSGEAFFDEGKISGLTDDNHMGAANRIAISTAILNDPKKIAAALPLLGRDTTVSADNPVNYNNNENAKAITELQHTQISELGNQTFNEYYSSNLAQIGQDVQNAQNNSEYYQTMYQQFSDRKQALTGVSLDEQFINLIKYQTTYNASAKMVNVADEMLQTIINLI